MILSFQSILLHHIKINESANGFASNRYVYEGSNQVGKHLNRSKKIQYCFGFILFPDE